MRTTTVLRPAIAAAVVQASLLTGRFAQADISPDPSSPDAHCSLAEQCADGAECPSGIKQEAGAVATCTEAQKAAGRVYRCHRGGNYLGTAVYCREGATGTWKGSRSGCGKSSLARGDATPHAPGFALGLLGGLGLLITRRRTRRAISC